MKEFGRDRKILIGVVLSVFIILCPPTHTYITKEKKLTETIKNETKEVLDKGNCITVSAIAGCSFYQEKDFIGRGGAGSAIKILYSDKLNEKNALFICTVLQKTLSKYDYTTMLSGDKLKNEFIYLPVKQDNKPNWEYMDDYIENLYKQLTIWVLQKTPAI